jgi:hypothetical protein
VPDLPFPQRLPEFQRLFPDDKACASYLERIHWPDGFRCRCGETGEQEERAKAAAAPRIIRP